MATPAMRTRRWSRKEYERLVELDIVHAGEPIELVGGHLIVAEPKGGPHATAVELTAQALRAAFGSGWAVRAQNPIALDAESEPEPDVVVVTGALRDYRDAHPSVPALLVEVADTTLALDRRTKGSLYARGGVADYWIVNLAERVLEVYRRPVADPSADFGASYADLTLLAAGSTVAPLAHPDVTVAVADLLP